MSPQAGITTGLGVIASVPSVMSERAGLVFFNKVKPEVLFLVSLSGGQKA